MLLVHDELLLCLRLIVGGQLTTVCEMCQSNYTWLTFRFYDFTAWRITVSYYTSHRYVFGRLELSTVETKSVEFLVRFFRRAALQFLWHWLSGVPRRTSCTTYIFRWQKCEVSQVYYRGYIHKQPPGAFCFCLIHWAVMRGEGATDGHCFRTQPGL